MASRLMVGVCVFSALLSTGNVAKSESPTSAYVFPPGGQRGTTVPVGFGRVELAIDGLFDQFQQVALQSHQDGLRFRVAQAAVELQHLGVALGINHQAGVEKARIRRARCGHAGDHRLDHFTHHARMQLRRDHGCG